MTKTELLLAALVTSVLVHALFPRYDWRDPGGDAVTYARIDRWTGTAQVGQFYNAAVGHVTGKWASFDELRAMAARRPAAASVKDPLDNLLKQADEILRNDKREQ